MARHDPKRNERHGKQRAFLAAYAATGRLCDAASAAGVHRSDHYTWLENPTYRAAWDATQDQVAQTLEDEAVRRAVEGTKRPFMYKGAPVKVGRRILYEHQYSDPLLLALLKRFRPALYREHTSTEITGSIDIVERLQTARKRVLEMQKNDAAASG